MLKPSFRCTPGIFTITFLFLSPGTPFPGHSP